MNDAPNTQAWPADQVERRRVAELAAYPRNARTHSEDQVNQIAASMQQWGWTVPLLVDEHGMIIAGHGRLQAAQKLGLETVPVMVARGWTDAQKNAYRIADNQIPMNAGWDPAMLRLELGDLKLAGFDLNLIAFGKVELVSFMTDPSKAKDPEAVVKPEPVPITRPGEIWVMGDHRLGCGDATDAAVVAAVLAGAEPTLMDTDPPYGVSYNPAWRARTQGPDGRRLSKGEVSMGEVSNDDRCDWRAAFEHFQGDVAYVWHSALHAAEVEACLAACKFNIRAQIIWRKQQIVIGRGDYHWQHEPCFYAVRDGRSGHYVGDRKQSTVWDINNHSGGNIPDDQATHHGTQKPVECMARPIRNNTREGETVYDPFVGSGTTVIACQMTGRRALAIDLDPVYVDVTVRRWQAFAEAEAVLEGDGRTFAEIAAERTKPARGRRATTGAPANGGSTKAASNP